MATTAGTTDRHCCRPFSRGTLLVLVMNGLLYAAHWFVFYVFCLQFTGINRNFVLEITQYVPWMLLPVTGWVTESWLGRYRAIVTGLIMCTLSIILMQVAFMTLQFFNELVSMLIIAAALIICTIGGGSLYTNMLPFTLDQMIGASAEELSAVVQWYWWGWITDNEYSSLCSNPPTATIPGHSSSGLTCAEYSEFVSCPDNGLPMPQVVGHP